MPIRNRMIYFTFICFILTGLTGIWMRLFVFTNKVHLVDYTNILHAHSHIAILGWTFLAVVLIFFFLNWDKITNKKHASALITSLFIVTISLFIAFIYQGYAMYSIILSTLHIFVEYWAIIFIAIHLKRNETMPKISKLFVTGALVTLFISSIGPFALGAIASQGLRESPIFDMAIYFYLHFQYNGWLYFMLIGSLLFILSKNGFRFNTKLLKISFWTYFLALFPGFFLSVLWYDFSFFGLPLAVIGAIGQLVGVLLLCYELAQHKYMFQKMFSTYINFTILFSIFFLIIKSVLELGLLFPSLAEIVYDTRSVVIGYLHLTLLGFVTIFILAQFQMIHIIDSAKKGIRIGINIFLCGFLLNEAILFLSGLYAWLHIGYFPFANEALILASSLLFIGIVMMILPYKNKQL